MSEKDITYVTHRAHTIIGLIEDIFDKLLILPHINTLYAKASDWNNSPIIQQFVKDNQPIYPISQSHLSTAHFETKFNNS